MYLTNRNSQLLVSILTTHRARFPIYRQNMKFPPSCTGKADTHGKQACIQIPTLPDAAKSETASVMWLSEGFHHHRTKWACSRDWESPPTGAGGPGYALSCGSSLWHQGHRRVGAVASPVPTSPVYLTDLACTFPAQLASVSALITLISTSSSPERHSCFTGYVSVNKMHPVHTLSTPILKIQQSAVTFHTPAKKYIFSH